MEIIIVSIIIAVAVVSLICMFKKQADGKSGCACDQNCAQCPMENPANTSASCNDPETAKDPTTVIPSEAEESV